MDKIIDISGDDDILYMEFEGGEVIEIDSKELVEILNEMKSVSEKVLRYRS